MTALNMKNPMDLIGRYFKIGILVGIIILSIFLINSCRTNRNLIDENLQLKQANSILSNNVKVANDTMEYWKDSYGNSLSEISILTATSSMLKSEYSNLNKQYKGLLADNSKSQEMIAYLKTQIDIKDRIIEDLSKNSGSNSYILNDSTIKVSIGKVYDSVNYYSVNGTVYTRIKDNKIYAGRVDLTTQVGLGLDLAVSRDTKTGIAHLTSRTAFPARVQLGGITKIEDELNRKPSAYLGLGIVIGYGATIQKQPQVVPYVGLAAYFSPKWLTIKIHRK